MAARLLGLDPPRALHQHAGDDLQAVGDAVLKLLQQDRLLAQQIVLELLADPRVGDVGHRDDQPDIVGVAIVELAGVDHQAPADLAAALQVHLIGVDLGGAGGGGPEQRAELRHVPLAVAQRGERPAERRCPDRSRTRRRTSRSPRRRRARRRAAGRARWTRRSPPAPDRRRLRREPSVRISICGSLAGDSRSESNPAAPVIAQFRF